MFLAELTDCQKGFSLIEVLVAVVVLSIGLLGLAGLQATGLRNNHSAYLRSQATVQAYDMMDRVRANIRGFNQGYYHQPTPTQNTDCLGTAGCTPQQMANHDAFEWNSSNSTLLPSGSGVICRDSTPEDGANSGSPACDNVNGAPYAIKLWWIDERDGTTQRFVTSFRP